MKSEKEIESLAGDIDLFLNQLIEQYQLQPLEVSAVILARIMRMNMEIGESDTFNRLMQTAMEDYTAEIKSSVLQ